MSRLVLSQAVLSDFQRISNFMAAEKSGFIISHSRPELEVAVDAGLFFIVEDAGEVIAVAYVADTNQGSDYEVANCLVAEPWRGFGLQPLLILVRVAAVVSTFYMSQRLVVAVDPENPKSRKNIERAGFQIDPRVSWDCGSCPKKQGAAEKGRLCCCDSYVLPLAEEQRLCREFLETIKYGPVIGLTRKRLDGEDELKDLLLDWNVASDAAESRSLLDFIKFNPEVKKPGARAA